MLIDGEQLIKYLKLIHQDAKKDCKREIDYIIEEIESGSFTATDDNTENKMWLFERIADERKYQDETHEFPEHMRLAVLMEEVGEVAKETTENKGYDINLIVELTQVAAVAVRWIEALHEEK